MSEQSGHEHVGHESGVGKTAGLPGQNADPRADELSDDERADTVAMGDVADADPDDGR